MKYPLYILCLFFLGFSSCKKTKIREGIEGLWLIEKVKYNSNYPDSFSGTFEFENCPKKSNKIGECKVIKKLGFMYPI